MSVSIRTVMGIVFAVAVVGAVAGGFYLVGTPGEARLQRFDTQRVADLRRIASGIDIYRTRNNALPDTLEDVRTAGAWQAPPRDPETGAPYEYRILGPTRYELCATFARASEATGRSDLRGTDTFWAHTAGRQCFPVEQSK